VGCDVKVGIKISITPQIKDSDPFGMGINQNSKFKIQNSKWRIQNGEFKMENSKRKLTPQIKDSDPFERV
jgi:hypothetical protein